MRVLIPPSRWQFLFLVRPPIPHSPHLRVPLTASCSCSCTQIEAIPTLIMAVAVLLLLPSFPFSATFLTPREKAIAQARLNRDHRPQSHGGMNGWAGFKAVVNDVNAWALMIIYASCTFYLLCLYLYNGWLEGVVNARVVGS